MRKLLWSKTSQRVPSERTYTNEQISLTMRQRTLYTRCGSVSGRVVGHSGIFSTPDMFVFTLPERTWAPKGSPERSLTPVTCVGLLLHDNGLDKMELGSRNRDSETREVESERQKGLHRGREGKSFQFLRGFAGLPFLYSSCFFLPKDEVTETAG